MGCSSFQYILFACTIYLVLVVSEHTIFECHGDMCNIGKVHQFCSNAFKYCRNCDDIKEDCGTAAQPLNCTAFCIEIAVAEVSKHIRNRGEDSCLVMPVMMNIANGQVSVPQHNDSRIAIGSELVYSCDNGYTLNGPSILECMRNGTLEPTTMPYCSDNALTDIVFRHTTIGLSIICCILLTFLILCFLYKINSNKLNISRTSTDSSLNHDEEPLIDINKQQLHHENERPPVSAGSPRCTDSTRTETRTMTPSAVPSAPPPDANKIEEEAVQTPSYKSSNDNTQGTVVVNQLEVNVIIDGAPRTLEAKETFKDQTRNDNSANDQTRTNRKSLEEKMPTEESDEIDAVEETNDEKIERGTKPLPARDADSQSRAESTEEMFEGKEATLKGPQPVPAVNEENIQTPTSETAESIAMVGIHGSTFQKNDIKKNETKFAEKSEDHNSTQELAALK